MKLIDSVTIDSYYWADNALELNNAEFPADPGSTVDYIIVTCKPHDYDPVRGGGRKHYPSEACQWRR